MMMTKPVTISARIPQEDAAFISQLNIEDAKTPSDKLRAIISEARRRQESQRDYRSSMLMIQDLLGPIHARTREIEMEEGAHSELVSRIFAWLPDTMAFIIASEDDLETEQKNNKLSELESGIADRIFLLMESVLQMAITNRCTCYDTQAIQARIEPILDMTRVITIARQHEKES